MIAVGDRVTWVPLRARKMRAGRVIRIDGPTAIVERREGTRSGRTIVRTSRIPLSELTREATR